MAVTTTKTNKPLNPRGNDQSPLAFNRAKLYSGKALDFDGVNDSVSLDGFTMSGTSFSVSFYAKPENAYYFFDSNLPRFLSKYENGFQIYNSIGWTNYGVVPTDSIGFFTIVNEGTTQKAFFNGIQIGNDATITAINLGSTSQFAIGNHYTKTGVPFNGQIAGFKILNTALTAAQVADLYNNPEKVVPTGVDNTALRLWLPMMEGAGTTAYDGSGNGNHGTISGATYVNGVGAPVSQSAVMDWNKGVNYVNEYSEDFSDAGWEKTGSQILASSESNPYGKQTWEFGVVSLPTEVQIRGNVSGALNTSTAFKTIVIAKAGTLDWLRVRNLFVAGGSTEGNVWFNLSTGSVGTEQSGQTGTMTDLGNGWYKCEVSGTSGSTITNRLLDIGFTDRDGWNEPLATGGTGFLVLSSISLNGIYVQTLGVDQTSPVLLPQGLTTGRDITGVNLFENVRKQGALNLDGNSWAEVHDNASLDFSSGMTLEAWFQIEANSFGRHVLGKWNFPANKREYLIYWNGSVNKIECYFGNGGAAQSANVSVTPTGQWVHFVGTTDGSTITPYLNGVAGTTAAQTTSLGDSDIDLKIGTDDTNTDAQYRMNTPIAQPRIYNRALTAEEVERNYNAGKNIYTN